MIRLLILALFTLPLFSAYSQCNLDFGGTSGTFIFSTVKFEYSETILVDVLRESEIAIQPTVVISDLQITLPNEHRNSFYKIFDSTGRVIQNGALADFLIEQKINLDFLNSGNYFIQIGNDTAQEIFRFIKIN